MGSWGWSFDEFSKNTENRGADDGVPDDLEAIAERTDVHDGCSLVLA